MAGVDLSEGGNHLLGQAVCQVFAITRGTEVVEGQDCDDDAIAIRLCRTRVDFDGGDEVIALAGYRADVAMLTPVLAEDPPSSAEMFWLRLFSSTTVSGHTACSSSSLPITLP